jgi:hypothetical protein
MAAYSLKSPKLSKALIQMGLPEKVVSQALSTSVLSEVARISSDVNDLLEMGDSKHYKSCQRAGHPQRVVEELIPYLGKSLWLLVVGQRMSINGKGFVARRLLRLMYRDTLCTEPAGIYLEAHYGDLSVLSNKAVTNFFEAHYGDLHLPLLGPGSKDKERVPLYCPSAVHGYNDTLRRGIEHTFYTPISEKVKSLTQFAYSNRERRGGVYLCSLAENIYNPQNGRFSPPPLPTPWRGLITSEKRAEIEALIGFLGYPKSPLGLEGGEVTYSIDEDLFFVKDKDQLYIEKEWGEVILVLRDNTVVSSEQRHGFCRPLSLDENPVDKVEMFLRAKEVLQMEVVHWDKYKDTGYVFDYDSEDKSLAVRTDRAIHRMRKKLLKLGADFLEVCSDVPEKGLWAPVDRYCEVYLDGYDQYVDEDEE